MIDPNPYPATGVMPLHCTSLEPGTFDRRWGGFHGATWDEQAASNAVMFFRYLKHTQGPLTGQEFVLAPDQAWLVREAFGWMREDGSRLFRIVFVEMGRGNGKSQLGAGIAGKLLLADGESDPEVVGAASDRRQARKYCLNRLKAMIALEPRLLEKVDIFRNEIRLKKGSAEAGYEATSADVAAAWGGAPHGIIFDEVHAQPNRELWDALETAMGKRKQPMMWGFTTAGWDQESLCFELHEKTRDISEGNFEERSFLGVVWAADIDADWTDPQVWRNANPMMGLAFQEDFLAEKCTKAVNTPAFQNTFRTMYLSQWVGQETRFLDMNAWDRCAEPVRPAKIPAWGGLDLASTTDLAALAVVSRHGGRVQVDLRLYAPRDGLRDRSLRDRVPYEVWARDGLLTLTPGPTIDQDFIKRDVLAMAELYDLKDVNYDRWNATKLISELTADGVECVMMGQGFASMSAPTKELLRLVTASQLAHGGNPALRWMANNATAVSDAAENLKPAKDKSTGRIDGIVALIMALDGLQRRGQEMPKRRSVYDTGDVTWA